LKEKFKRLLDQFQEYIAASDREIEEVRSETFELTQHSLQVEELKVQKQVLQERLETLER